MKKVLLAILVFVAVIIGLLFKFYSSSSENVMFKIGDVLLSVPIPVGYLYTPESDTLYQDITIDFGKLGDKNFKRISIGSDQTIHFLSVADYQSKYLDSGDLFTRCSSDGAGGSSWCDRVLDTTMIRDDDIKVFRHTLRHVRETYNYKSQQQDYSYSSIITFDVLLPSFELLMVHPDQSVDSDAVADAEYIVKNIELKGNTK